MLCSSQPATFDCGSTGCSSTHKENDHGLVAFWIFGSSLPSSGDCAVVAVVDVVLKGAGNIR